MSDEEMDGDTMDNFRPHNLPEGIKKEIIKEADDGNWRRPNKGDDLTVHYVGTLEDGTKFDSSRDRGEPINFPLGQGQVIKGWEEGIATMRKGEIAKFTFQPQFAYGEAGNPPTIPANAVLTFEVELISWVAKDDVFRDGGVVKSELKEGSGYENPKKGEEVKCNIRVLADNGDVIEEKLGYEAIIGSSALEPADLAKVVDKVLGGMRVDERVSLDCRKGYVYKDKNKVKIEIHLEAIYETTDVSFLKDGSVMKKRVYGPDNEYSKPGDDVKATIRIEAVTDGSTTLPGFPGSKQISFITGAGEVCDALESAAVEMKKGERAIVTCTASSKCIDSKLGLSEVKADKVVFTLEMIDFGKALEIHSMGGEEKMIVGMMRKENGGELFKRKRFELALMKYKKVIELMNNQDHMSKECKIKAAALKHTAEMNKAACYLQLGEATLALATCNSILETDRNNSKVLLRRAKAQFSRHEPSAALKDLERVLELDPDNSEAKSLVPQVKRAQKVLDKESTSAYKTMFQNLDKVGFGKENKKPAPAPKKEEPADEQSKDFVAVSFKLEHKIEPGEQLWVTGEPEVLGAWDVTKGAQLKRVPGPPDYEAMALGKPPRESHLWEAVVQVPVEEGRTQYHYVVRASSGDRVEGEKHTMQLEGMGGSRVRCADKWRDKPAWEPPSEE